MDVNISQNGTKTLVKLSGRLDTTNVAQFQKDIEPLMTMQNPDLELDCKAMEYTSSQGLRAFLMLQKCVTKNNGKMVMINMQKLIKDVFDITGFSNIITIK